MDSRRVQRLRALVDAQKSRGLLVGLWADPLDSSQLLHPLKASAARLALACLHNLLSGPRVEAGDAGEQGGGGDVQIHAHCVHRRLNDLVEAVSEASLVDVMLIHAHPEGLGIDFDELRERILHAPRKGHGTAERDIHAG